MGLALARPTKLTCQNYQLPHCKKYQVPPGGFCIKNRTMEFGIGMK